MADEITAADLGDGYYACHGMVWSSLDALRRYLTSNWADSPLRVRPATTEERAYWASLVEACKRRDKRLRDAK